MIAYIYFKESLQIICKINNVININIIGREINGDGTIIFGESQDFIILQSDTINKSIGDVINLNVLDDERNYFTKGKEIWLQEKINKLNNVNTQLNDRLKTLETDPPLTEQIQTTNSDMNTALLGIADVYELVLGGVSTP